MTDELEQPRMTVAEIGVMREIVKWRREAGHLFAPMNSRYLGHWAEWRDGARAFGREVTVDHSIPGKFAVRPEGRYVTGRWYVALSFTEAVDILVALGYLPARFSTAYRAGWDAAMDDERVMHDDSRYPAVTA